MAYPQEGMDQLEVWFRVVNDLAAVPMREINRSTRLRYRTCSVLPAREKSKSLTSNLQLDTGKVHELNEK